MSRRSPGRSPSSSSPTSLSPISSIFAIKFWKELERLFLMHFTLKLFWNELGRPFNSFLCCCQNCFTTGRHLFQSFIVFSPQANGFGMLFPGHQMSLNALCCYQWKLEIQKFWKVNAQFLLNFDPNLIISVLTGEQLFKYWRKNICIRYLPKMWYLLAKNLLLVSDKLQIRHTSKLPYAEKKTSK